MPLHARNARLGTQLPSKDPIVSSIPLFVPKPIVLNGLKESIKLEKKHAPQDYVSWLDKKQDLKTSLTSSSGTLNGIW